LKIAPYTLRVLGIWDDWERNYQENVLCERMMDTIDDYRLFQAVGEVETQHR